jgi:small redox-active disulfide protein 2
MLATEKAAQALGLPYELEKVTDLRQIMAFGVMTTPALVLDGKVKVSGKVPSVDELKTLLKPVKL